MNHEEPTTQVGLRLKAARKKAKLSQETVAKSLDVTRQAYSNYELGKALPNIQRVVKLAEILGVTPEYLMEGRSSFNPDVSGYPCHSFPVIGEVTAGFDGAEAAEVYTGETVDIPESWLRNLMPDEYFVLRASGDSMYPDIQDGDLLLVRKTNVVDSGEIGIVVLAGGSGTVKRIEYSPGRSYVDLVPRNPEYKTKRLVNEEVDNMFIQGEVRKIIRDL